MASFLQQSGAHSSVSYGLAANSVLSYLPGYEAARARAIVKSSQKHNKIDESTACKYARENEILRLAKT